MAYTEIKILQTIDRNDYYELVTAELPGVDLPCYGIRNVSTGIVEMSTSVLPNARRFLSLVTDWTINPPEDSQGSESVLPDMPEVVQ